MVRCLNTGMENMSG